MNDRAAGLLEQYDIEVIRTRKGRGAILCDTEQGCLIFREYKGTQEKCMLQDCLLRRIRERADVQAEVIVPTSEGELLAKDGDGNSYILKTYYEGRECNIYDREECLEAVRMLARLHDSMEEPDVGQQPDGAGTGTPEPVNIFMPSLEYEKHNREIRRVRQYLRKKGQKAWFEICLQQSLDYFLEQAEALTEEWSAYSRLTAGQPECRGFCHGDYQYHNIIRTEEGWRVINFEKCIRDNPVRDLYLLLRKLLEKSDWSIALGSELLNAYDAVRPLSAYSRIDLYYRLSYPEKFWKIVNFYYNSGKAWIPERNMEKLNKLRAQEPEKRHFLETVFQNLG